MSQTVAQYAVFNAPIAENPNIPLEDTWLFTHPIHTFPIDTPKPTVFRRYLTFRRMGVHPVGTANTPVRCILKVRQVHYTGWTKVLGADAASETEGTVQPYV